MVKAVVVVGHQPYSLSVAKAAERLKGEIDVEMFYMWDLRERPGEFERAARKADFAVLNVMDSATAKAVDLDGIGQETPFVAVNSCFEVMRESFKSLGIEKSRFFRLFRRMMERRKDNLSGVRMDEALERGAKFAEKMGWFGPLRRLKIAMRAFRYWDYGGPDNVENMLLYLARELADADVREPDPPKEVPSRALYDPKDGIVDADYLKELREEYGTLVPVTFYKFFYTNGNTEHVDAVIEALREEGIGAVGCYCSVDAYGSLTRFFADERPDSVVALTCFRIVGGPMGGEVERGVELFRDWNTLYFVAPQLWYMDREEWEESEFGMDPLSLIINVSLPELDSAIFLPPVACQSEVGRFGNVPLHAMEPIPENVERAAELVYRWIELRRHGPRKIAIILFNYPPGEENVGEAAYLDTFSSLRNVLELLEDEMSLKVDLDKVTDDTLRRLGNPDLKHKRPEDVPAADEVSVDRYLEWLEELPNESRERVFEAWGDPEDDPLLVDGSFRIFGLDLGDVFVGFQPTRGLHESEESYHDDTPPTHYYVCFYEWLSREWGADVILHFGTHGTLEFLPGKEKALSRSCFPDLLITPIPHVYLYNVNNPSEAAIAKHRTYTYTVSHLHPPLADPELDGYRELLRLCEAVREGREDVEELREIVEAAGIDIEIEDNDAYVGAVESMIRRAIRDRIPCGLHVIGANPDPELIAETVVSYAESRDALKTDRERAVDTVLKYLEEGEDELSNAFNNPDSARELVDGLVESYRREQESLLKALRGEYLEPSPGGEIERNPEVVPTGRNLTSLNPRRIPTPEAEKRARKAVEELLERHFEEHGEYPKTVGIVLWAFETMQTGGETVAMILELLGVRPVRDDAGNVIDVEPVPAEELGRPRVDVVVTMCGIFRDTFPNIVELIDRAVRKVAELDEPEEVNPVKKNVRELKEEGHERPETRIFGPRPDLYAADNMRSKVESSRWDDESELIDAYLNDIGYAYGEGVHGEEHRELFETVTSRQDATVQIRSHRSYDIIDLDHYYEFLGGLTATAEDAKTYVIDSCSNEEPEVHDLKTVIRSGAASRLLNRKWKEHMLKHGYDGCREIAKRVENLIGLAATTDSVEDWIWEGVAREYLLDDETRERMEELNPAAVREIASRLLEAHERGYWDADEENINKIEEMSRESR
ncbi:cobaltochelatase subunit CobN [Methanopyrus sp. KOL6]|uniref:cobaltochelatase subunit CobN n=1 Tax=Methanopyrus sp. KOL6 TaxID=1937004 RepID=UPI000B4ABD3C|nr:cobaltochelatase subunit CobN [Methanopyrus sp. KOL6]